MALSNLDDAVLATCSDSTQLVVVGGRDDRGMAMAWTGDAWLVQRVPAEAEELWWCWIDPVGTVWAVGENATVVNNASGTWSLIDAGEAIDPTTTLYGVWGTSADDVYVVGGSFGPSAGPAIAHYDGSVWTGADVSAFPAEVLFKVWGVDGQVWAVGSGGTIAHLPAGGAWAVQSSPVDDRLIALWGDSADAVYAVGGDGRGVVLRYAAGAWTELALGPEALSGVWTAPGKPLYIGGNRGYLGRFGRDQQGAVDITRMEVSVPVNDLCIHSVTGFGEAVVAAGADLFGGDNRSWRGGLLVHNGSLVGNIDETDAGIADAALPPADASLVDAGIPDAAIDATPGPDASLPGPGEMCGAPPDFCEPGLVCWQLFTSGDLICTQDCVVASECEADYGVGACCARPGPQTVDTVCIPAGNKECTTKW